MQISTISYISLLLSVALCPTLLAQQTSGLFLNDERAFNGYTLFGNNEVTYLIDNCGFQINSWESDFKPGNSMYLLEDGNLLRTAKINGAFSAGGAGGRFELFNWDGDLVWAFNYADDHLHAHHDIEPLPSGNFLALAWEKHSSEDAQFNGRAFNGEIWSEHIVEFEILDGDQANVVWQWRLWDHLIQEVDSTKNNFGNISEQPARIDINYIGPGTIGADWIHLNAISYNPQLDQIAISSRNFSEIWVIDHSTTTDEAATDSGGNSGKGGDILYRFGNPLTYKRGTETDRKFFRQHDVRWIPKGLPGAGSMMIFNNSYAFNMSRVEIWTPVIDSDGNYPIEDDKPYGPPAMDWIYSEENFHSNIMSSAQIQPNGNVLVCEGAEGKFIEVTSTGEIVWEYLNPVNRNGGPAIQGGTVRFNDVFRVEKYAPSCQAFAGHDLTPGDPIELSPWESQCGIVSSTERRISTFQTPLRVLGNPFGDQLLLEYQGKARLQFIMYNIAGELVAIFDLSRGFHAYDVKHLRAGVYFGVLCGSGLTGKTVKLVKQ